MGTIKEVFVDRTLDDEQIPAHIVFVGALKTYDPAVRGVCHVPASLNELVLNLGSLAADQESIFIASLINMRLLY